MLRPALCDRRASSASTPSSHQSKESQEGTRKEKRGDTGKAREREDDEDEDETTLSFAIFALRDLKEGEEVVLGEYVAYVFVYSFLGEFCRKAGDGVSFIRSRIVTVPELVLRLFFLSLGCSFFLCCLYISQRDLLTN